MQANNNSEKKLINFYKTNRDYYSFIDQRHDMQYFKPVLDILKKHKISLNNKKVIDIGSGTGAFLSILKQLYKKSDLTGTDLSSFSKKYHKEKGLKFILSKAQKLSCKDESYDFVFSVDTFEHLVNPESAILEIYRITKKNGYLLIRTRNYRSPLTTYKMGTLVSYLKDFVKNNHKTLKNTKKLIPELTSEGGDKDAVSAIFIDHLLNSVSRLNGEILESKTWTKGGFWNLFNMTPVLKNLGSMSLILFKKGNL